MDYPTQRTCVSCFEVKEISLFKQSISSSNGKPYIRKKCKTCWNKANSKYGDPEKRKAKEKRAAERTSYRQKVRIINFDPLTIARRIKSDSAKSDREKGYENDLDVEFILGMIQVNCSYCDRDFTSCRMSLDRVDNGLGHLRSNVVPSCQTCNLVRGNMPYEAWLHVAPGMKSAREAGLLDGWDGPRLNRKTKL